MMALRLLFLAIITAQVVYKIQPVAIFYILAKVQYTAEDDRQETTKRAKYQ